MAYGEKSFGLREVRITPYNSAAVLGTPVALPIAQTLSFRLLNDQKELKGDDQLQEIALYNRRVEASLEKGGISLEAAAIMTGGTVTTSSTTPTEKKELAVTGTNYSQYFRIEGRTVNADGTSGSYAEITYCKAVQFEGEMKGEEFFVTKCSLLGLPHPTSGRAFALGRQETAAAFA